MEFGMLNGNLRFPDNSKFQWKTFFLYHHLSSGKSDKYIATYNGEWIYVCTVYLNIEYLVPQQRLKEDYKSWQGLTSFFSPG